MSLIANILIAAIVCCISYFPAKIIFKIFNKKMTDSEADRRARILGMCLFGAFTLALVLETFGLF